ncbi:MAG: hypothetical protein ACOCWR_01230 [Oceanidesulfovibrio sp.]
MAKHSFLDPLANRRTMIWILGIGAAVLVVMELVVEKHPHFPWEEWTGFYGAAGFVAGVILVLGARYILAPIVRRRENFYD